MAEDYVALNFLEQIVEEDITNGFPKEDLRFRFPPEPNGYLHIGHCKAICISFGLGEKYNAPVNLRFDDTNPSKEEQEYVDAIQEDIKWLGFKWDKVCYSSDYFQQLYDWAIQLIKEGKAYIDSQSSEAMAEQKGTPTEPGTNSPYRERSVEENLELFEKMAKGEFAEGVHVLRAKIDMQSPNMLLRDPIMYRVINKAHHRTGNTWNIYPMYDWAHGESDYVEQVSHSLCSLEFKPHRPLYEWFVDNVYTNGIKPKQREFARLNLSFTIMSKRKLLKLVQEGIVSGWDDPRMPTISGIRRRGYTPAAIRNFIDAVGVAKRDNVIDVSLLEFNVREDLNKTAPRVMAVLDPVKLVITNYPEDQEEWLEAENNQEDESAGYRKVPFSKELYIEKEDFKENANSKYFRLTLGKEVRLKNAYIIKGESVVKDADGNITEIHCTYDAYSRSGSGTEASLRKVKGTLHWVSIKHAIKAEVRLYDRLFNHESPDGDKDVDFMEHLNPNSLETITGYLEPSLSEVQPMDIFQFQRLGYFNVDKDSTAEHLVFNKTVGLRDTWAKVASKSTKQEQPKAAPKKQIPQIPALNEIKKVGKKLAQVPDEKRVKAIARIRELAKDVDYEELKELFNTSAKKIGTRLAVLETLIVLIQLNKVDQAEEEVAAYLEEMKTSGNELLENSVNNL
ncbi:glutamine--tRNA ligase/YqeY domain fusion protein [Leeuwenhoekiella blandensis]|uniref:Glutamine--tRNA ligase n=1 Tax=Leeuwenhoekiella blandensis (strain CECT 7118 / CCUG 51940 / KCTC 22103 / MED217) TaxID=398720 RepID=A3XRH1_LEEBM|nr:glutamine--tRNA ligase/YqeY domain fusion protein [Leeuwenhoekiella blandensis]EAQ47852.1 glutaminyl-tRNA synthetase [Leeuwenhoekiella blandensis MED217]